MLSSGFDGDDAAAVSVPEFAAVADSLGARGETIRSVSDLRALGDGIVADDGPVVDCKVDPTVRHPNQFE